MTSATMRTATPAGRQLVMLDLCTGLGGASAAMKARGWRVVTVDNRPELEPSVVCDVRSFRWEGGHVDLLWASPPCVEFSKQGARCFYPDAPEPSCELAAAALRLVMEIRPRFWLIENVRGAIPYFGALFEAPAISAPPVYLWGRPPPGLRALIPKFAAYKEHASRRSDDARAQRLGSDDRRALVRALVPFELSDAVAVCCEAAIRGRHTPSLDVQSTAPAETGRARRGRPPAPLVPLERVAELLNHGFSVRAMARRLSVPKRRIEGALSKLRGMRASLLPAGPGLSRKSVISGQSPPPPTRVTSFPGAPA